MPIDQSFPSAYNSSDGSEHEGAAQNFQTGRDMLEDRAHASNYANVQVGERIETARQQRIDENYPSLKNRERGSTMGFYGKTMRGFNSEGPQ